METQNNNVSQETESQAVAQAPVVQANVAPSSGGNPFDQAQEPVARAVSAQPVVQASQAEAQVVAQTPAQPWAQQPATPQAPAITPNAQPWNQQAVVAQAVPAQPWAQQPVPPAPTLEQMWNVVNSCIDGMQIRNFVTIRNKYSNGELVKSNVQQPQAQLVGFGLCMNKGAKQSMGLTTRSYNRMVCDLADAIAKYLGGWNGVDVNATNASAIDVFDRNMVQRPRQPQPQQYAQPQQAYAPQYAPAPQQAQYGYAQPPQQPQYAQAPQRSYYPY